MEEDVPRTAGQLFEGVGTVAGIWHDAFNTDEHIHH
jgi:hypothetical protein